MKMLKKILTCTAISIAIGATTAKAELTNITVGTNPSGSTFYLLGGGFSKLFQEKLGIRSSAQPFMGSSVYLPMIQQGDVTLGISSTVDARMAYTGGLEYPAEMTDLRALANVWELPYAFITRADSGINTIEDLAGKRVMGDIPASQALTLIDTIMLRSGGLELSDVEFMKSGGLMDGINALVEGRVDAAPVATTMPVLTESNSSVPGGLRIIANGKLAEDPNYYSTQLPGIRSTIAKENPKRPYIIGDTPIVAYNTLLVGNVNLTEDDAYLLTKTLYDNWEELQKDYGPLRGVQKDDLLIGHNTVPYHDGSIRFFKELGLWTDANQEHQDALLK